MNYASENVRLSNLINLSILLATVAYYTGLLIGTNIKLQIPKLQLISYNKMQWHLAI